MYLPMISLQSLQRQHSCSTQHHFTKIHKIKIYWNEIGEREGHDIGPAIPTLLLGIWAFSNLHTIYIFFRGTLCMHLVTHSDGNSSCFNAAIFPNPTSYEMEHKTEPEASNKPPDLWNMKPTTEFPKSLASY
jgi:hypothetical protein